MEFILKAAVTMSICVVLSLVIIQYFEEILFTAIFTLGLGLPLVWFLVATDESGEMKQRIANLLQPIFS